MLGTNSFIAAAIGFALMVMGCGPTDADPACGNRVVDPGEECDPPDGVFCDSQCQNIDPCAPAGVCDDGNECTENNCSADPSDNTAFCDYPNLSDGTTCDGGNGTCSAGRCTSVPSCGNGTVDPGEECDPPDGVFCDSECKDIDICDPNLCDDENGCTENNCSADPSDNTAICDYPNLPDGTACDSGNGFGLCAVGQCELSALCNPNPCTYFIFNPCRENNCTADPSENMFFCDHPSLPDGTACGGSGTCDAGECVSPDAPVLSNMQAALFALNECGLAGSSFEYTVDFTDPNGDVPAEEYREELPGGARVFVRWELSNGWWGGYESASFFNRVTGDGFAGSASALNCRLFDVATWADITLTIWDASGNVSNSLTVRVPKPPGAD